MEPMHCVMGGRYWFEPYAMHNQPFKNLADCFPRDTEDVVLTLGDIYSVVMVR